MKALKTLVKSMFERVDDAQFYDESRQRLDSYDFSIFRCDVEIIKDVRQAFIELTGHYHVRSRRQVWRSVIKLMEFAAVTGIDGEYEGREIISEFGFYLEETNILRKTIGSHFNLVRRLVVWLSENNERDLWQRQRLIERVFQREKVNSRSNYLSKGDLKKIVGACKKEISEIRRRFSVRERALNGEPISGVDLSEQELQAFRALLEAEKEGQWAKKDFELAKKGRLLMFANLRNLNRYRELTSRDVIPIYVLLMIETAGNPYSIMELSCDCLQDHPVDESMCFVNWTKGRASVEQSKVFRRDAKYSAPQLIELVKSMTSCFRSLADEPDKKLLFLTRSGRVAKRLSVQTLHNRLLEFRNDNDLPFFTFEDIRKSVAELVKNATGSVGAVSRVLQHRNIETTSLYLQGKASKEASYERLYKFQGKMISLLEERNPLEGDDNLTYLGFKCDSPLSGVATGSVKGQPCLQYLSCATCVNAIVVLDDPRFVARMIRAEEQLLLLKTKSVDSLDSLARFESVFKPILLIIQEKLLGKVRSEVMKSAKALAKELPPVPVLF